MIDPRVLKDVITPAATDDPAHHTTLDVEKDLGIPVADAPATTDDPAHHTTLDVERDLGVPMADATAIDADGTSAPASNPAGAGSGTAPRDR